MCVLRKVSVACPADGRVVVRDLRFGPDDGARPRFDTVLQGHVVLPALINAHDHLHQNCVPRLPQGAPFANSYAWAAAFRGHFATGDVQTALAVPLGARLWHGALKNVLSGVTTVVHHDRRDGSLDASDFPVTVPRACAWAHSLHLPFGPDVRGSFHDAGGRMPWIIHLAEGTDALAAGELQELRDLGCLGPNTILVHGVGLTDAGVADVIRAGAGVVWCPSSNLSLLGATLAPHRLRALFDAHCLALGTDSRLTGARDLLAELELAAAHSDFSPRELLQLVTQRAAQMLGLDEGADCIIVRGRSDDPFASLHHLARSQLRAVVRHGEPCLTDPDFAGWFDALGIPYRTVRLDGGWKLCRSDVLGPPGSRIAEPGLTLQ